MKQNACAAALLCCLVAGAVRFWDLLACSEIGTGFVAVGSVWMRYGALALLVVGVFVLARICGAKEGKDSLPVPAPRLFLLTAIVALFAGGMSLYTAVQEFAMPTTSLGTAETGAMMQLLALMLRFACGLGLLLFCVWCLLLALRGEPLAPKASATRALGLFATIGFLALPVLRYAENPASVHRILRILPICSALAALLFVVKLLGILCEPLTAQRRRAAAAAGVCAFLLCTCIELPQTAWLVLRGGEMTLSAVWVSLLLGLVGLLGAATALAVSEGKVEKSPVECDPISE